MFKKTMKEVLEDDCDAVEQKIHTDKNGEVQAIEVKYVPKDIKQDGKIDIPSFMNRGGH